MSSEGSAAAVQPTARKQNVSCDACKFRKVKCDRRAKIESRREMESEDSIACSICTSHGLRCTFTQAAEKKNRRGRRIVAFQQGHLSNLDSMLATQPAQVNGLQAPTSAAESSTITNGGPYRVMTERGLFDVEGLTKPLLDACFKAYFKFYAPCVSSLQTEILAGRYKLYFSVLEENNGITQPYYVESDDDAKRQDRPLSEILMLAVGCSGASLLEPPITELGSDSKFRLQDLLALKFRERLDSDLVRRLKYEGTDIVEACYIMADPFLSILGHSPGAQTTGDPLRIRPASSEGIVRLLFRLNIHRRPTLRQDCPPGDNRIWQSGDNFMTEMELFRRMRVFWTCFMQDSFRSMGEKTNHLISNDGYDWDLPRFVPRQDGSYDSLLFCQRESDGSKASSKNNETRSTSIVCLQANHFVDFDIMQVQVMLRLAFVIRTVSIKFISPRSQGRSVLVSDLERAVSALTSWYQQLPSKVTWEAQIEGLDQCSQDSNTVTDNEISLQNALKAFFVESLYHANVYNVWSSVDQFGTRTDLDMAETAALFASSVRVHDDPQQASEASPAESLPLVSSPDTPLSDHEAEQMSATDTGRDKEARDKLDQMTAQSFIRMSKIGKEAARLNLVRASRLVFVSVFCSFADWGCRLAHRLAAAKKGRGARSQDSSFSLPINMPPGCSEIDYIFKCVEDLIYAMGAIDSFESAKGMAMKFTMQLQESKVACQDERRPSGGMQLGNVSASTQSPSSSDAGVTEAKAVPLQSLFSSDNVARTNEAEATNVLQNALGPIDLDWLQQYFQEPSLQPLQDDGNIQAPQSNLNGANTAHLDLASTQDGQANEVLAGLFMNGGPTSTSAMDTVDDNQWSQFLTYSDAQNWANAQWQGFLQDSTMT